MSRPLPRFAAWLLRVSVPERWSDSVVGDFEADWVRLQRVTPRTAGLRISLDAAGVSTRMLIERHANTVDAIHCDIRESLRALRRRPAFAAAAIGVIALGVGLHTTAFAVVDRVLLTSLPYPQPEQLVELRAKQADGTESATLSSLDLEAWAEGLAGVASVGGYQVEQAGLLIDGQRLPVSAAVAYVTPTLIEVLGVPIAMGRPFASPDGALGRPGVAIVAAHAWRALFPGVASPLGVSFRVANQSFTVVGVAETGSRFPEDVGIWLARETAAARLRGLKIEFASLRAVGRIHPGATANDVARLGAAAAASHGRTAIPVVVPLHDSIVGATARTLRLAWTGVGLLFLIACANAGGLLIARIAVRRREFAMRTALGASRFAILRHAGIEATVIAACGAVPGLVLAAVLLRLIESTNAGQLPLSSGLGLTMSSVLFTVALVMVASTLVAAAAATGAAGKGGSTFATARGGAIVALQLALCAALIVSAAITGAGLWQELTRDQGFNHERLLILSARPASGGSQASSASAYWPLLDTLERLNGITAVSMSDHLPPSQFGQFAPILFESEAVGAGDHAVRLASVTPGFFRALEIPIIAGRTFMNQEIDHMAPVAIVDERLALRAGGATAAIGKRLLVHDRLVEVIGVAGRLADRRDGDDAPILYRPLGSGAYLTGGATFLTELHVALRHSTDTPGAIAALKTALTTSPVPLEATHLATMDDRLEASLAGRRFHATIFGALAALGVALATLGVYGLASHLVQQSTRDLGVRIALGASPSHIVRLVIRDGMTRGASGALLGVAFVPAVASLVAGVVEGAASLGLWLFATVVTALAAVVVAGYAVPAWRAIRVDPVNTLKCE